jgi:heme oxygenase
MSGASGMVDTPPAQSSAQSPDGVGLAARLRAATAAWHTRAERAGIVADLLRGRATRGGYALLLRNLLPVYQAIEDGLWRHRDTPALRPFARPDLFRAHAIAADLAVLGGTDALALLPAGARYAERVRRAESGDAGRLIAHAYVRTLGDLSGGRLFPALLARTLALPAAALTFYDYKDVPDLPAAKAAWRAGLDQAAPLLANPADVAREAQIAFRLNVALAEAVHLAMVA